MAKRMASILLVFLLVLGLAACGGGSAHDSAEAPASVPASTPNGPTTPAPPMLPAETATGDWPPPQGYGGEEYDNSPETGFLDVIENPLSTFSSDVDTASYSNMRRMINEGTQPQGVRIEELVNYFDYSYPRPNGNSDHPFTISTEVAPCPWNEEHLLAMIGIQGAELEHSGDIANNIVFLLDVSGSMNAKNKLPLLKESFKMLIDTLGENDIISIVTYAGQDAIVADSVSGTEHTRLKKLIDSLEAGGSTAGAQGLYTAYELAQENFIKKGNNRIILATDGDFNVGPSSDEEMTELVEKYRDLDIFISVLGFGMGNLKDSKMESIADHGNGNYAYIDTMEEARKVLVHEFDAMMFTIAKDLKIQVEFNPGVVQQYRLIGYNNRRLDDEDFEDDEKDAGDVGAGHSVTAFYELVPVEKNAPQGGRDYIYHSLQLSESDDFMTVKVRYKAPTGTESMLVQKPVTRADYAFEMSDNFGFASAIVEFGLILTNSEYRADSSTTAVIQRAKLYMGDDPYGLKQEFVELVRKYQRL